MSVFDELMLKVCDISKQYTQNFNNEFKAALECIAKFEEDYLNGKRTREKSVKEKNHTTTLQSINEDENENVKLTNDYDNSSKEKKEEPNHPDKVRRNSKKRSKNEVDDMSSPEPEKRQKRNASVKAQSVISKQVNVNLTQKLRRDESIDKSQAKNRRRDKDEDKENFEPAPVVQIKQEKISLPEPMEQEVKPVIPDMMAMPPPVAPVPKPRKAVKEKLEETTDEETTRTRRSTRQRKPTERASNRSTRSSRATKQAEDDEPPAEPRPKRTRAKKVTADAAAEKEVAANEEMETAPIPENTRPKRTRRGQKAELKEQKSDDQETSQPEEANKSESKQADKKQLEEPKQKDTKQKPKENKKQEQEKETSKLNTEIEFPIKIKEEKISLPDIKEIKSPVLPVKNNENKNKNLKKNNSKEETLPSADEINVQSSTITVDSNKDVLDATRVLNSTVTISSDMDKNVLPNGVYNHAPVSPKVQNMNETVTLGLASRDTMVLDKPQKIMDATVVLDKAPANVTDDNSLLTDDSEPRSPSSPLPPPPSEQPTSAVKQKVQQFEELTSRVTRTKTRAMAKKDEQTETHTPPDKVIKNVLSAETLAKMNSMIFNGKQPQVSSSASKPREIPPPKAHMPSSTSKLSSINKAREAAEEMKGDKDARKKKEAMLEAKRELQKRKREEKMAAAAAAREAAEKERRAQLQAAARDRRERQACADLGRMERLRDVERKKQELARKVAETEERRKAEEQARQQRLAEEQKRAEAARRKQLEEAEAMKKEAALMAKEMERKHREFMEKQKMKRMENEKLSTPLKFPGTPCGLPPALEPVYMADGFEYLNSDEEAEPVERPIPAWSTSKARRLQLCVQSHIGSALVDRLFSVRAHSPDLSEIFPDIDRARLKRTSSAVWRTPPARLPPLAE